MSLICLYYCIHCIRTSHGLRPGRVRSTECVLHQKIIYTPFEKQIIHLSRPRTHFTPKINSRSHTGHTKGRGELMPQVLVCTAAVQYLCMYNIVYVSHGHSITRRIFDDADATTHGYTGIHEYSIHIITIL